MDNSPSHSRNTSRNANSLDISEVELIYLIAKYLSVGPCKKSYEVLKAEIEENKILPNRIDFLGNEHERTYNDFDSQNSHIAQDFLLQVVSRLEPTIQKLWPTFPARKASLLGRGSQSLLRSDRESEKSYRTLSDVLVRQRGNLIVEPTTLKGVPNATQVAIGREICGSTNKKHFLTNKFYSRLQLFVRNVGHLSAVYCMLFDKFGRYIITGADDMLVKIWSVIDGRLVATLRGASAEISDLALDQDNTLIAAGSCDKIIRVWSLQTLAPVAVLSSHTGIITALQFCPKPDKNGVLVSTGGDGCVAFWTYTRTNLEVKFDPKPLKLNEKVRPGHSQLICASFSTGGNFLAVGGADHFVRVYKLGGSDGIDKLLETEIHTDRVDSIQWCHSGVRFVSGSRDSTALIWRYQCQQWKTILLNMRQTLPGSATLENDAKLQVTMVGWDRTDSLVITASSDHLLRVWDSHTGVLKRVLEGHEDNAYVIEAHPTDNRLILTAGHDGLLFVWDVTAGVAVKRFKNSIEGQGHGALFDAKWSPDGLSIATTDSHGHILIFGIGDNELFKKIPQELFFHTDYRPLVRDQNHHILDEQTQMAPHLMPPPFLVNIDGDPYSPELQRLVPGRENCRMDQLIPNVVTNDNGDQEVLDLGMADLEPPPPPQVRQQNESINREVLFGRPNIDDMIERLAHEQRGRRGPPERGGRDDDQPGPSNAERRGSTSGGGAYPDHSYAVASGYDSLSPREGRVGARREGDIEGVRQSTGNWQRDPHMKWKRKLCLVPLTDGALEESKNMRKAHGELELTSYEEEGKKGSDIPPLKREDEEEGGARESRRYRRRQKKPNASSAKANNISPPKTRRGRKGTGRGRSSGRQAASNAPLPTAQSAFGSDFEDPDAAIALQEREEEGEQEEEEEEEEEVALSLSSSSSSSSLTKEALEEEEESSSSDSDNSTDYSDWTADFGGVGLEPPKRTAHKQKTNPVPVRRKKRRSKKEEEKEESEEDEEREEEKEKKVKRERRKRGEKEEEKRPSNARRKRDARNMNMAESDGDGGDIEEIPPEYRPPEWLGETVPKKAPYFPQMGDEIMYFRQGHQLYVEAVLNRQLYQVDKRSLPWIRKHNLRDQEYVKIIGIKYEIKPPRLCCLKLGIMDLDGNLTGDAFTIKYHDMPDVLDFLVLKSTYDAAINRNWQVEDRFRCIIDDAWWIGTVEAQEPHLPEFPDSMFMCYRVLWDNGERERLSPWDMECIDDHVKLPDIGGSIRVSTAEYKNLVYTPSPEDWAGSSFESECQRMAEGIGKLMELAVAEPFLTPVDLNVYPNYAMIVEYPMDLSTIKSRLESHFYRRPNAAQFDVRYIATNAEKFNKKGTVIVKHARIITDLALKLIKDPTCRDPTVYYHEVQNSYQSPSHSEDETGASRRLRPDSEEERTRRRTSGRTKEAIRAPRDGTIVLPKLGDSRPWQQQCRDLLKSMFERQDSTPFRFPVDVNRYEDYYQVIDVPMDLSTIREELAAGGYASPLDFAKDVRLVFQNSKTYNTNNKSRIYSMTVRLEAFFEDQIKGIFARCKKEDSRTSSPSAGPSGGGDLLTKMNGDGHYDESDADDDEGDKLRGSVNEGGKRRSRRVAKLRQLRVNDSDDTDFDDEEYSPQKKTPQKGRDRTISSKATHPGPSKGPLGRKSVSPATAIERKEKGGPVKRTSARKTRGSDSDFEAPVKRSASSAPTLRPKRSRRYEEDSDFETNSPPSPPPQPSSEEEDEKEEESQWKIRKRRAAEKSSPTLSQRSLRGSSKRYVKSETSSGNEDDIAARQNGGGGHSFGASKRRIESSDDDEEEEAVVNGIKEESTWSIVKPADEDEDEEEEEEEEEEEKRNEEQENETEEEEEIGAGEEDGSEDEEDDDGDEEIKKPPEISQKLRLTLASFGGRKNIEESEFECDEDEDDESEDEEEEDAGDVEKKKRGGQRGRKVGIPRRLRPKPIDGDDVEEDVDFVADFIDDDEASSTSSTEDDSEDVSDSRKRKKSKKKKMTKKEKEKKDELARKERSKRAKALARERAKATRAKAKALEKAKKARQKVREREKAKKAKEEVKRQAKMEKAANSKTGKGGRKKGSKDEDVTINSKVNFTSAVTAQLHPSPLRFQAPYPSTGPPNHPTGGPQLQQPALAPQIQMRIAPQLPQVSQGPINFQMHHTPISPHHVRPMNPQVCHVTFSSQMPQSPVRAQIYQSTAASQIYHTSPPPHIQYAPTTTRIHQAQVVAPLIQAPVVQQQFIVPANTYTSAINTYNSLPSYVPIAPNPHQSAIIASTATSQPPPPPYSSPPNVAQMPITFDSRTQAKQVIHGGRIIGTKITQIGSISGSSAIVSGFSGIANRAPGVVTGSPGVITGSPGLVTGSSGAVVGSSGVIMGSSGVVTGSSGVVMGSSGVIMGSSGVVTGSSGVVMGSSGVIMGSSGVVTGSSGIITGSSGLVTGSSGIDTGSSVVVTGSSGVSGSSGAATGSSGVVTESSSSCSDDDEDFEPGGSYITNGSWSRTRTRRGRIEEDSEEDEIGKRGRVRKKVRYNEDSEEGEASNSVSSRGRVRKANTRMKDFI